MWFRIVGLGYPYLKKIKGEIMDEELSLAWISKEKLLKICPKEFNEFEEERKRLGLDNLALALILRFDEKQEKVDDQKIKALYLKILDAIKKEMKLKAYLFTYGDLKFMDTNPDNIPVEEADKIFDEGVETIFVVELEKVKHFQRAAKNRLAIITVLI